MPTRPVVRHFFASWNGIPGTVVDHHRIADLVSFVHPRPGEGYPLVQPELCFFAVLTDGRGVHEFVVRQRFGVGPGSRVVWESRSGRIDLGSDPIAVHGFPMRFRSVGFPQPGQYEFELLCDGFDLATAFVEARVS
jgi:hypothetical protein